ncbi:hypothetical protein E1301_Tti021312 [Triplophysa tibetana]|uniref:Uncharacterized protein n=1 Tax=Triplophysa tibetana TaxID=1572043 RepID=A0A5A9MYU0_9TELE|nr:hypothetical protein E1301_Tti021312 [Triplophysa tibetana]
MTVGNLDTFESPMITNLFLIVRHQSDDFLFVDMCLTGLTYPFERASTCDLILRTYDLFDFQRNQSDPCPGLNGISYPDGSGCVCACTVPLFAHTQFQYTYAAEIVMLKFDFLGMIADDHWGDSSSNSSRLELPSFLSCRVSCHAEFPVMPSILSCRASCHAEHPVMPSILSCRASCLAEYPVLPSILSNWSYLSGWIYQTNLPSGITSKRSTLFKNYEASSLEEGHLVVTHCGLRLRSHSPDFIEARTSGISVLALHFVGVVGNQYELSQTGILHRNRLPLFLS